MVDVMIRLLTTALGLRQLKEDVDEGRANSHERSPSLSRRLGKWSRRSYIACAISVALLALAVGFHLPTRTVDRLVTLFFNLGAVSVGFALARGLVEGLEKPSRNRDSGD